jgi:hypothetical protein
LSSIIKLLWPNFKQPNIERILFENENGKRKGFIFLASKITIRTKVSAKISINDKADKTLPTQAQALLSGSKTNEHLQRALSLWGDSFMSWPRLYVILEEIEQYLKKPVDKAGLCSHNERKQFTHSANNAEISGKDARHASGLNKPIKNPMTLSDANGFLMRLLKEVLENAVKVKKV